MNRTVALLIGAGIVVAMQIGKVPVALPLLRSAFGITGVPAGVLISGLSLLAALTGLVVGAFADRLRHRSILAGGLALTGAASLAGALAPSTAWLLAARVAEGAGFIAVIVSAPALIVTLTAGADRRLALGLWSAYVPVGTALVLLCAPVLVAFGGWRALWVATAIAALAFAALVVAFVPRDTAPRVDGPPIGDALGAVLRAGPPSALAGVLGTYAAAYLGLVAFLPTILVDAGWSVASAAATTASIVLLNGAGNITGGALVRTRPCWAIMVTGGAVLAAGGALLYVNVLPLGVRLTGAAVAALASGIVPAAVMASVPLHAPRSALVGTTQGLVIQGSSIGQLGGPIALAAAGGAAGGPRCAALMAAFALVSVACALALRAPEAARRSAD